MTTSLYLADIGGYLRRVLFQVTQAGDSFGIVLTTLVFFYIWASGRQPQQHISCYGNRETSRLKND